MRRKRLFLTLTLFLAVLPTTGCLFHTRPVEDQYSKTPLKDSTQQGLIDSINQQAEAIRSLKATVDIDTSAVGGVKKGQVTDYKEIRGYVLARKPGALHMIGLMPVVRTKAFDMVSDGQDFKLWIPPKNRFVIGKNDVATPNTDQPMENIRPQNIYDALLIRHVDPNPEVEIAVMEKGYEILHDEKGRRILQDDYELTVIHKYDNGLEDVAQNHFRAHRPEAASADTSMMRDLKVATDARYAEYKDFDGVSFPSRIQISRPQEEFDITLNMLKVDINQMLTDDQFQLEQPPGADVQHLDRPQSSLVVPVGQRQ
jgi:hypothetical protein